MDRLISSGNFAESVIFLLARQKITDSGKLPLLIDLSTRDPNFLPTTSDALPLSLLYNQTHKVEYTHSKCNVKNNLGG